MRRQLSAREAVPGPFVQVWLHSLCKFYSMLCAGKDWFHFCIILSLTHPTETFNSRTFKSRVMESVPVKNLPSFIPIQFSLGPSGRAFRLGRLVKFHHDWIVDASCPHIACDSVWHLMITTSRTPVSMSSEKGLTTQ